MNAENKIKFAEDFVKQNLTCYDSGHDWYHVDRVRNMALYINEHEKQADTFILELTALLHDMADSKFAGDDQEGSYRKIASFLDKAGLATDKRRIINIIRNVSFSSKEEHGDTRDPVLLIIQDADKLDAMGAIGIARAFNYGGFRNNTIYDPSAGSSTGNNTTIGHFYEKLLLLKDMMNTSVGRKLAEERHRYLETFLEQFYREWNFGK